MSFFHQTTCSRCPNSLEVRTMSWFTEEAICMECSDKEREIKRKLRKKGLDDQEGCGYIPKVES